MLILDKDMLISCIIQDTRRHNWYYAPKEEEVLVKI